MQRQWPTSPTTPMSPTSPMSPVSLHDEPLRSHWSDSIHTPPSIMDDRRPLRSIWGENIARTVKAVPGLISKPWKPRPIRVAAVPARRGFRLDTHDRTFGLVSPGYTPTSANRFHETIHEDDEEQNNDADGHQRQQSIHDVDDDERMTLISEHDRTNNDVFLIPRNGTDFNTLRSSPTNSNIVVVSPSDAGHVPQQHQRSKKVCSRLSSSGFESDLVFSLRHPPLYTRPQQIHAHQTHSSLTELDHPIHQPCFL